VTCCSRRTVQRLSRLCWAGLAQCTLFLCLSIRLFHALLHCEVGHVPSGVHWFGEPAAVPGCIAVPAAPAGGAPNALPVSAPPAAVCKPPCWHLRLLCHILPGRESRRWLQQREGPGAAALAGPAPPVPGSEAYGGAEGGHACVLGAAVRL